MPVTELRVEGYRSIQSMTLPMRRANVIIGPNGCGKSNLYKSVVLLRAAAEGELSRMIGHEGGMSSVLWAGPRGKGPSNMRLGVTIDEFEYDLELGIRHMGAMPTMFASDPQVKSESVRLIDGRYKHVILDRGVSSCTIRNAEGTMEKFLLALRDSESVLPQIVDPKRFPHLDDLRRKFLKWRFYHGFRTDQESPLRRPQVAVRTWVLSSDGADLAAALQTIRENGDDLGLDEAIQDAFPGSHLIIDERGDGLIVSMETEGIRRPLAAGELSDGTLRYLALLAALLSPSPAPLLALNEPETSLHEDLLPPLSRLIAKASPTSQIWLTTHSHVLSDHVCELAVVKPTALDKVDGATVRVGHAAVAG